MNAGQADALRNLDNGNLAGQLSPPCLDSPTECGCAGHTMDSSTSCLHECIDRPTTAVSKRHFRNEPVRARMADLRADHRRGFGSGQRSLERKWCNEYAMCHQNRLTSPMKTLPVSNESS